MSLGHCKFKQCDTTTHLPEWLRPETLPPPSAVKDVEHLGLSLVVRMQMATDTLEGSWAISYETKHTLTAQSSNHPPWYLPERNENLCVHKKPSQRYL